MRARFTDNATTELEPATGDPNLCNLLSIQAWAARHIAPPDRLLGDLVTTTTRTFLVGRTGLGKTMVGFGMACGMASGSGFLHWQSTRPAKVLYIDGEMSDELIKARSIDVLRRTITPPPPGNLIIFSRDVEDEFASRFPTLGRMAPLNTEAGKDFIHALIAVISGVDVVIFDNVMSLIAGDQKDEIPWSETLPLVSSLTTRRIGQVWLDHTGHNSDRQYGSSTKAWRFDTVGIMTPLPNGECDQYELAFKLSFEHPGKARRRTPDNWEDFQTCTVRLRDDQWTSEPSGGIARRAKDQITPVAKAFHNGLLNALANSPTPGTTTRNAWFDECVRLGLVAPIVEGDTHDQKERQRGKFRKNISALKEAGWIRIDGDTVRDLTAGARK